MIPNRVFRTLPFVFPVVLLLIIVQLPSTAAGKEVEKSKSKPENWKVEFSPEKIDSIEPGDLKQVEMTITPYEDALVGDYSVNVNVEGEKVSKNLEFRTTVKASAAASSIFHSGWGLRFYSRSFFAAQQHRPWLLWRSGYFFPFLCPLVPAF